ncbi:Cleavage and polyadenylation specificity factor subunit 1 [Paragonimus heterotremus]|uniref:Cleavage and polyadenylation specificity factor subunit 1 n=1 Tax=Paragonimus heterotremus TaxID=100268 RepID=A0A8J4WHV2_9TREM|nr:Cleavage and polyadenylation specificity factor subunit 1 [Paragonimus heterotremus]
MAAPHVFLDPTKPTTFSAVFKHVSPPTAIENCLFCHVVHPRLKNLVTTRGCFVDIYCLKEDDCGDAHLNWLSTTCVYENIIDIAPVRFIGDKLDSLLISFNEAKVAVMGFDSILYELKTLSLHNYEFENLKSGRIQFSRLPILRVDPLQRCAVLLVYDRHLAVMPFRRSETLATGDKYLSKPLSTAKGRQSWERRATAPLLATFTTCLSSSTGEKINNVLDMQFLHGFYEPTLLVLYEPIGTWAGRVSARRDTCCIVALSFNLQKRTNPVIWFQESLPYDCSCVYSVPQPIGGVLVMATNSIIYMKQTLPSCGLPLNCNAQITTNFPMRQEIPQCAPLTLDNCRALAITDSQFLIAARTGKIYLLSLWVEQATQTVSNLLLHEVGCAVPPHCLALLDTGYLFIGSRLCDSVLLRYTISSMYVNSIGRIVDPEAASAFAPNRTVIPMLNGTDENSDVDHLELLGSSTDVNFVTDGATCQPAQSQYAFDEVDVELYGESVLNQPSHHREILNYTFQIVDRLVNFGPMGQLTAGEVPCLAPGNTDPTDEALTAAQAELHHVELIACIPRSFEGISDPREDLRAGGVLLLHTSVRPRGLTAFELPEYMSLWSLYGPPIVTPVVIKEEKPGATKASDSQVADISAGEQTTNVLGGTDDSVTSVPLSTLGPSSPTTQSVAGKTHTPDTSPTGLSAQVPDDEQHVSVEVSETHEPLKTELDVSASPLAEQITDTSSALFQDQKHSYLLLTREDSTMILEVSHEIVELEVSGFNTTEMTVTAANLGDMYIQSMRCEMSDSTQAVDNSMDCSSSPIGVAPTNRTNAEVPMMTGQKLRAGHDYPYIIQVSPTSVRLLDGPKLIEYIQVTLEWRIHLASCADPYVLLCTEDDELFLIRLRSPQVIDAAQSASRLSYKKPSFLDLHALIETSNMEQPDLASASTPFATTSHLEIYRPKVAQVSAPLCFCLYHDRAGQLSRWLRARQTVLESNVSKMTSEANTTPDTTSVPKKTAFFPEADAALFTQLNEKTIPEISNLDEEDILLYGELIELCKRERSGLSRQCFAAVESDDVEVEMAEWRQLGQNTPEHSRYFAFILFSNGVLEIYSLPEFTVLYEVRNFSDLPTMLIDHRGIPKPPSSSVNSNAPIAEEDNIPPPVLEITVFSVGRDRGRPVLMARTSQEIAFFEALCPPPTEAHPFISGSWTEEGLRWRRLAIPCPLIAPRRVRTDPKIADVQSTLLSRTNMLRPFENIDGHRGVFVCGSSPMWLFSDDLGRIHVFHHSIDGIMGSFAPLNTIICPSGFVYFTYSNEMRLATLPPGYSFKEPLGMRWIPLPITPYFLQYHIESKTYAVVGTRPEPCSSVYHLNAEGNKEEEQLLRPVCCVLPSLDRYTLQIYAPSLLPSERCTWQPIPNASIEFEAWEVVTCMTTAQLASEQTFHGTKDYLALGTNLTYGEEIPVRGRIIILDLIDVVPEPGQPLTRHKLKTIYDGEQKGPVTAMTSCQGHLISAIGQKVYIWTLKNGDLVGVAFVDSELYIHSLLCVKNLVLAADVLKSIHLLRFQSDLRVLSVVSRDNIPREVYTSNFFVDGRRLGFAVSDEHGNVVIYSYDPLDSSSRSGRRLVRRADLRLPARATCSLRVANRLRHALLSVKPSSHTTQPITSSATGVNAPESSEPLISTATLSSGQKTAPTGSMQTSTPTVDPERLKHSIYLGTQSGAVFLLGPLRDKMYSRLRITEKNLIHHFGPTCGMLPKSCWNYRSPLPELANPCGQVADADLLWRYLVIPHSQRLEIARKSGQSLEGIMDDIAELNATSLHF